MTARSPNASMTTLITAATSAEQLRDVRDLMRAFIAWHRVRHRDESALIDRYFDPADFEAELQHLPGVYAPPAGRLLLATVDGRAAGCVALRDLGAGACEMKRMYVHTAFQRAGVGRALVHALLAEARATGYTVMRLDTGPKQVEALTLYRSVGFRPIAPYYELPDELRDWLVFMEAGLA
jgi:putative acetyltransferase